MATTEIACERCGRTTTDPDLWDHPEVDTGRVLCGRCWDVEHPALLARGWQAPRQHTGLCDECHHPVIGGHLCARCRASEDGHLRDVDEAYEYADATSAGPFG